MWNNPEPDGDRWETSLYANDHYVIDFILLSPGMAARQTSASRIYAWDHDPELGGPARFHAGTDGTGPLKHYRVSDHRPVACVVDFAR
jgi:hypothetical protein